MARKTLEKSTDLSSFSLFVFKGQTLSLLPPLATTATVFIIWAHETGSRNTVVHAAGFT